MDTRRIPISHFYRISSIVIVLGPRIPLHFGTFKSSSYPVKIALTSYKTKRESAYEVNYPSYVTHDEDLGKP